jgi:low affinity Fe/Cu permease
MACPLTGLAPARRRCDAMNSLLFKLANFLSRPPGFFVVLGAMVICVALVPAGFTDVVTFALSVAAVVITSVVLIQGHRDTSAMHAKLDEIIVALRETRNDVVGLEHAEPHEIRAVVERLEREADAPAQATAGGHPNRGKIPAAAS